MVLDAAASAASLVSAVASTFAVGAAATLAHAALLVVPVFKTATAAHVATPATAAAVIVSALITAATAVIMTPRHLDLQQIEVHFTSTCSVSCIHAVGQVHDGRHESRHKLHDAAMQHSSTIDRWLYIEPLADELRGAARRPAVSTARRRRQSPDV